MLTVDAETALATVERRRQQWQEGSKVHSSRLCICSGDSEDKPSEYRLSNLQ